MSRRPEEEKYEKYEQEQALDDEVEKEDLGLNKKRRRRRTRIWTEEDDDEDNGRSRKWRRKNSCGLRFLDLEVEVDDDDDDDQVDEDKSEEDDFIVENGNELPDGDEKRRMHYRPLLQREDEDEDYEDLARRIQARYAGLSHREYEKETNELNQQALLPSITDTKLFMVKCTIGKERELAASLMQKSIDKGSELRITSVIALHHLKNYIYIEAYKEAHVKEACKGLRHVHAEKIILVPIREMASVLSVQNKAIDLSQNTWSRMKDGRKVAKKKAFVPPPRFMNIDSARRDNLFKKGYFSKGDSVLVIKGELKNLRGWVEKVDEETVYIKLEMKGLPNIVAVNEKELCKYFKPGIHVKIVSGTLEGATGMVIKVEQNVLIILSDTTKEHISAFANDVVVSSEVTSAVSKSGEFHIHSSVGGKHRGGRGHDGPVGATVKIFSGLYKGYRGRIVEFKGPNVRVELESQMKVVSVDRKCVSYNLAATTLYSEIPRYDKGSETPMHPSGSPFRPFTAMSPPMFYEN